MAHIGTIPTKFDKTSFSDQNSGPLYDGRHKDVENVVFDPSVNFEFMHSLENKRSISL